MGFKDYMRKKYQQAKEVAHEYGERKAEERKVYKEETQRQSLRVAKERARVEADARIQRYKQRVTPTKRPVSSGFGSGSTGFGDFGFKQAVGGNLFGPPPTQKIKKLTPKKRKRRTKKKGGGKSITIRVG